MNQEQINESLKKIKTGLVYYLKILAAFNDDKVNVSTNIEFQKDFNYFFQIKHTNKNFHNAFYSYLENNKINIPSFEDTLRHLTEYGRLEASYSSKLLAIIDPNLPIWDKYVLSYFEFKPVSKELDEESRIKKAIEIYDKLKNKYNIFLKTDECKIWIDSFDKVYPDCPITPIKKVDFIIWQNRQ